MIQTSTASSNPSTGMKAGCQGDPVAFCRSPISDPQRAITGWPLRQDAWLLDRRAPRCRSRLTLGSPRLAFSRCFHFFLDYTLLYHNENLIQFWLKKHLVPYGTSICSGCFFLPILSHYVTSVIEQRLSQRDRMSVEKMATHDLKPHRGEIF